jgi:hypothetical protein
MVKLGLGLLVAASLAYLALAQPASPQGTPEQAFHRTSRTLTGNPVVRLSCSQDTCIHGAIPSMPIDIPDGFGPADVVATLTMEYEVSPGVTGGVVVAVRSGDQPFEAMRPGLLRFRGPAPTTTSASWLLSDVPTDQPLSVRIRFRKVGPAARPWHVIVHEALLVFDAVPAAGA